jgi:hypothetical protein
MKKNETALKNELEALKNLLEKKDDDQGEKLKKQMVRRKVPDDQSEKLKKQMVRSKVPDDQIIKYSRNVIR